MNQEPPRTRSRAFSSRSDKSNGSKNKLDLVESPQEKSRRDSLWKGGSKANPNAALTEVQPGVANVLEESTLQSLRDFQHKDVNGNVIVDPDLSNPTRPRLERPLDTIRSFEKAIDNGYKRRSSYMRQEAEPDQGNQFASRRNSYFNGNESGYNRHSQVGGGYYGSQRPEGQMGGYGGSQRMRYGNRMQSESALYGGKPYPQHNYHQSHDTVNTGVTNGSDSTGPWANSTDPSSENSSLDRMHMGNKPPQADGHGPSGYGQNGYAPNGFQGPIMEEGGAYGAHNQLGRQNSAPLFRPQSMPMSNDRRPIPLGTSGPPVSGTLPSNARPEPEKRKSWLKRRFSKKE